MLRRSITTTILIALVIATALAAAALWSLQQQTTTHIQTQRDLSARVEALAGTLLAFASAQQGYVAPGQLDEPLFERTAALLRDIPAQVDAIAALLRSDEGRRQLTAIRESLGALAAADARSRENLSRGQEMMAADVIYSDGINVVEGMTQALRQAQQAEQAAISADAERTGSVIWMVFGAVTLVWVATCAGIARMAQQPAPRTGPTAPDETVAAPMQEHQPSVDPLALASLCTDLSRVDDRRGLETLLARTAGLLGASGVMLWMGAGDRLFAALAHGYPSDLLPRMPGIPRDADNAAAEAWRREHQVQQAASGDAPAAVVTPLFNPQACIGVLALELNRDRVIDRDVGVAASLIGAQLATIVAAWPAASMPRTGHEPAARTA